MDALATAFSDAGSREVPEEDARETTQAEALGRPLDENTRHGRSPAEGRDGDRAQAEAAAAESLEDEEQDKPVSDEAETA